jgi:hypothetical protein
VRHDGEAAARGDWRRPLRRKVGWVLAAKLAALVALKLLFFSGDARVEPTPGAIEGQLKAAEQPGAKGALRD